jgi:predicted RNase H-like nuclease (RuvC/YqgF family)
MSSEDVLSIAVEKTQTLERFSRGIDQEYISQQDTFFQSVFEGVKEIYDYLKAEINEVVVDGQFLVFNFRYGNNRVKRIKIQLIREDIDQMELANRKMEKMQERFTTQLLQNDIEIKELKQKYEEVTQILQEIKDEIRAEKAKTRELAESWRTEFL